MKLRSLISHVLLVLFTFSNIAAQSRDGWRSVRTNHLFVIGNADPENLRRVAVWLEFFHAAFAHLVSRNVIDSSVPTTVIVFRDDASKSDTIAEPTRTTTSRMLGGESGPVAINDGRTVDS